MHQAQVFNRWVVYSGASSIGSPQMYLHVYSLHSPGEGGGGTSFLFFFFLFTLNVLEQKAVT